MGESAVQNMKQKTAKKHKLHNVPGKQAHGTVDGQPATKRRKRQVPVKKNRKKLKQQEQQLKKQEETFDKYKASAITYLQTWKNDKDNWKFSKNIQNWIVAHMFDSELLPDSVWETALEYFAGSKGAAKTSLVEVATKMIEGGTETSETTDEETKNSLSVKQTRAKDIIQFIVE